MNKVFCITVSTMKKEHNFHCTVIRSEAKVSQFMMYHFKMNRSLNSYSW